MRMTIADTDSPTPQGAPARSVAGDLALIEDLIERARRELEGADLGIKLTDLVRLLEFKSKLKPAVDAESAFWSMIDQMRHEELQNFGEPQEPAPARPGTDR